jgi:hypothetical protein
VSDLDNRIIKRLAAFRRGLEHRQVGIDPDSNASTPAVDLVDALVAVLALHKRDRYGDCVACGVDVGENPIPWPCDTVCVIVAALGVATGA